jgi:hypothetical protein
LAYDDLRNHHPGKADREYLKILHLAATESEEKVHLALDAAIRKGEKVTAEAIEKAVKENQEKPAVCETHVQPVDLKEYDGLLKQQEVA